MSPDIGYPDYQRVVNWDSPSLWQEDTALGHVAVDSPILDVSRYGYLGGMVWEDTYRCVVVFNWFLDSAATVSTGNRYICLWSSQTVPAQLRVPNLGPFCIVSLNPVGTNDFTAHARLFATNRSHPLEVIPRYSPLLSVAQTTVTPGQNRIFIPPDYYSGPVMLSLQTGGANLEVSLYTLDEEGVQQTFYAHSPTGATENPIVVVPLGGWALGAYGSGGVNATFGCVISPSFTGSS